MNAEQLNAIKERAEKATSGPWYRMFKVGIEIHAENDWGAIVAEDNGVTRYSDAEFIIHAREDIPALVAEVERLRKELSFIANVDMVTNAYDVEHVAVSVKSWALNVLDGINHDGSHEADRQ